MRAHDAPAAGMGQALNWLICFSWNLPCFFSRDTANAWISVGILSLRRDQRPWSCDAALGARSQVKPSVAQNLSWSTLYLPRMHPAAP